MEFGKLHALLMNSQSNWSQAIT